VNPLDLSTITVTDFKSFFSRDFSYAQAFDPDNTSFVTDDDINKAFSEAKIGLNQGLFSSDDNIRIGYLYLTAHYLVNDLKTALQGIGGVADMPLSGRTVGSVSETYSIPKAYTDDPILAFYTQSRYGMKYLSLVLPSIVGNVGVVAGATVP
jgi:hypothetical protein